MIGRIIDGRYRIHSLVAIGGMGRVYKAEQSGLGRTVAVKVLSVNPARPERDCHFRERFALEAATASRLTSPNTITIFQYGQTDDDIYYIVMEYVEGITLGRLLKLEGRLSIIQAVTIVAQVCLSLREAHARGIVHRDIKPSNIMLVNGDYDQVKVLDFGIAKQLVRDTEETEADLTSSRRLIGTPEYMAPENIDGKVDRRSDIYSVGVMLYVAVTGRVPFKGKTGTQTILKALHDPAPEIDPAFGVPPALGDLILACLEKDPDQRPSSVDDVLHALQLCLTEVENGGHKGQAPASDRDMEAVPLREGPLTATQPFQVAAEAVPRRFSLASLKLPLAAAAIVSVGVTTASMVRRWQGSGDRGAPTAPRAAPAAPAPSAATPPVPAPTGAPLSLSVEEGAGSAVRAATPPPVPATDKPATDKPATDKPATDKLATDKLATDKPATDESATDKPATDKPPTGKPESTVTGRRTRRGAARVRSDRPAPTSSLPGERRPRERDPSPAEKPKPEDPVPDGYKPSPY